MNAEWIPAKTANVVAHTGLSEERARALVTGEVRLRYRMVPRPGRSHCSVRFALEVASLVRPHGEPTEDCTCADCEAAA